MGLNYKTAPNQLTHIFFVTCILLCLTLAYENTHAATTITVNKFTIAQDETFTLRLESAQDTRVQPDLSVLSSHFRILDTKNLVVSSYINGSRVYKHRWTLLLQSRQSGDINIPPIPVGNEITEAIQIFVVGLPNVENDPSVAEKPENTVSATPRVLIELTPSEVYVNGQTKLTTRLLLPLSTTNYKSARINPPQGYGLSVESVGQAKHSETRHRGITYNSIEQSWLLFPSESGTTLLDPLNYQVNSLPPTKSEILEHDQIRLAVLDRPNLAVATTWIPSSSVTITDNLEHQLTLPFGKTLVRRIEMTAVGVKAAILPSIDTSNIELATLSIEDVLLEETSTPQGLISKRIEVSHIQPTEHGEITLPAVVISWWDIATDTLQTSRIPARIVRVQPPHEPDIKQDALPVIKVVDSAPTPNTLPKLQQELPDLDSATETSLMPWVFTGLAVLLVGGLLATRRKSAHSPISIETPSVEPDVEPIALSEPELFDQFTEACQLDMCDEAIKWLTLWGQHIWPDDVSHFSDLTLTVKGSFAIAALLEAASHQQLADQWQGDILLSAMTEERNRLFAEME